MRSTITTTTTTTTTTALRHLAASPLVLLYTVLTSGSLVGFSPAGAQEVAELITDRPDQTESSVVVPRGSVQLELGWTMTQDQENGVRFESNEAPGTLLRIGLSDWVELRIGWVGLVNREVRVGGSTFSADGAGDGELAAKIYLRPERGSAPEVALLVGTSVPVGDDQFTSDRYDPSIRLLFSHSLGDHLDLGYNLGLAWGTDFGDENERSTLSSYLYTIALGIGLSERLGAFVEFFGEIPASASGGPAHSFDGGLTYLVRDNLQLDLAAGLGLSDAADDWFVGLGVTVRLPS